MNYEKLESRIVTDQKKFQDRYLLSLDLTDDQDIKIVKTIMQTILKLSQTLIRHLFDNDFDTLKNKLEEDSTKAVSAGMDRIESFLDPLNLGKFYPYLFSFHQFFHSSYRARQGVTLEKILAEALRSNYVSLNIPDKKTEMKKIVSEFVKGYTSNADIDIIIDDSSQRLLVLQLRSGDKTGGTTAKGSLVDALRDIMKCEFEEEIDLTYIVGIWDEGKSEQKQSTINKIYNSLESYLKESNKINKEAFAVQIDNGIEIDKGVVLKLAYGLEKILRDISEWLPINDKELNIQLIKEIEKKCKSDDLWLAYTIVSLEMQNIKLHKKTNIEYLDDYLTAEEFSHPDIRSSENYVKLANQLTAKLLPKLPKGSVLMASTSEQENYIRDIILLWFINEVSKA